MIIFLININNVQKVFVTADYLVMSELKLFCELFMIEELNFTNLFVLRSFGQHFHSGYLVNKAVKFNAATLAECVLYYWTIEGRIKVKGLYKK